MILKRSIERLKRRNVIIFIVATYIGIIFLQEIAKIR